jgi:Tol biopolymer transport system component
MRNRILVFIPIVLLLAAGCAAQPAPTPTPPPAALGPAPTAIPPSTVTRAPTGPASQLPSDVNGKFVFAPGDGSIWVQDAPTAALHAIVSASPKVFSEAPQFSPDGSQVAFMQTAVQQQGPASISIQLIGTDGTNQHTLIAAPNATSSIGWPTFSGDGKWIYYTLDSANHRSSSIQRVPVGGGAAQKVLDDGRQAVVSPDGKSIAFVRFSIERFTTGLWIADGTGKNPRQLLRDDTFLTIAAPHFSPDGQWILFTASGPPRHQLQGLNLIPARSCEPWLLCSLAQPAYADGLPWDLWLISTDGTRYRQLTNVGGDSPWPAWSHDGKYVAFFQTNGIFLLDVNSGAITQLSRNGGHGIFDWWSG